MDNAVPRPLPYRRRTARSGRVAGETSKLREDERLFQRAASLKTKKEKRQRGHSRLARDDLAKEKEAGATQGKQGSSNKRNGVASCAKDREGASLGELSSILMKMARSILVLNIPDRGPVAYGGLSGGQRVLFDSALAYAPCNRQEKLCYPWLKARNGGEIGMLLAKAWPHPMLMPDYCLVPAMKLGPFLMAGTCIQELAKWRSNAGESRKCVLIQLNLERKRRLWLL